MIFKHLKEHKALVDIYTTTKNNDHKLFSYQIIKTIFKSQIYSSGIEIY